MSTWQELQDAATAEDIGTSDDAAWADWWIQRARETADQLDAVTAERDGAREGLDAAHALGRQEGEERGKRLAETIRDSWQKEVAALEAQIEGLTAERDHHRQAAEALRAECERLRARGAELEDAERIAWAVFVGRYTGACILYRETSTRNGMVAQWILEHPGGQIMLNLCPSLNARSLPMLTPEARAIIDAAREEGGTETTGTETTGTEQPGGNA